MNRKKILISVFILVALIQLFVPAKMIINREIILKTGNEYKFKTIPIDPTDPFRGKYITLRFDNNTIEVKNVKDWTAGETIYILLSTNSNGFATIKAVSKDRDEYSHNYLKAKVSSVYGNKLNIEYPFDRYYMEESKAYNAEISYRKSLNDTNQVTYALVVIKEGEYVLKDVLINGVSIKEIVEANNEN